MKRLFSLIMCSCVLAGCSSGGGSSDNDAQVGYLTHNGIRGLSYETQSQSGITGPRGDFRYYPGETITFRLGSLVLAENVPAKERLSPLDLEPAHLAELHDSVMVDGLSTHKPVESELILTDHYLINVFRLLLSLDADDNDKNGIYIQDKILDDIAAYPLDQPINFHKIPKDFGNHEVITAPENLFVWALCFDGYSNSTCSNPYAGRRIKSEGNATSYMQTQSDFIFNNISTGLSLSPFAFEIASNDRSLHTVTIRGHRNELSIAELEVVSTDDSVVAVHSRDPARQQVTFYNVSTEPTAEATLWLNIRLADDYRWIKKPLNVLIHPNPMKR